MGIDRARASLPPLMFAGAVIAMVGLSMLVPAPEVADGWLRLLGLGPVALGVTLHVGAWEALRSRRTPIRADGTPRVMVTGGPFARTRNPMYLAGVVILVGLGITLGTVASLAIPVAYGILAHALLLPAEERVMEDRFGDAYREYRASVPTWI